MRQTLPASRSFILGYACGRHLDPGCGPTPQPTNDPAQVRNHNRTLLTGGPFIDKENGETGPHVGHRAPDYQRTTSPLSRQTIYH
jgi:hypothetical protein